MALRIPRRGLNLSSKSNLDRLPSNVSARVASLVATLEQGPIQRQRRGGRSGDDSFAEDTYAEAASALLAICESSNAHAVTIDKRVIPALVNVLRTRESSRAALLAALGCLRLLVWEDELAGSSRRNSDNAGSSRRPPEGAGLGSLEGGANSVPGIQPPPGTSRPPSGRWGSWSRRRGSPGGTSRGGSQDDLAAQVDEQTLTMVASVNRRLAGDAGAVQSITGLLGESGSQTFESRSVTLGRVNAEVQEGAAWVLGCLALDEQNARVIREARGIQVLVGLLWGSVPERAQAAARWSLAVLLHKTGDVGLSHVKPGEQRDPPPPDAALRQCFQLLGTLMGPSETPEIQERAAWAIAGIGSTGNAGNQTPTGIVVRLVELLGVDAVAPMRRVAAYALLNLTRLKRNQDVARDAGAVRELCKILEDEGAGEYLLAYAAMGLSSLVQEESGQQQAEQERAVATLVHLIRVGRLPVQEAAVEALASVCQGSKQACRDACQLGALDVLRKLLAGSSKGTERYRQLMRATQCIESLGTPCPDAAARRPLPGGAMSGGGSGGTRYEDCFSRGLQPAPATGLGE